MEWYFVLLIVLGSLLLLFLIVFFILFKPGNVKKCYKYDWLFKAPIAHRGYFNNEFGIVENTTPAFKIAIERGYNIETDLSLTKDNYIVIYHDNDFKRLYGLDKKVEELTLEEIKALKLSNSDEKILEFSEFLSLIDGKTGLLLEFKSTSKKRNEILCKEAVRMLKDYKGHWAAQSFDPVLVSWFKKNYPLIPRGQLYMKFDLKKYKNKAKGKGFKGFVDVLTRWLYNNKLVHLISKPVFIAHDVKTIDLMTKFTHCYVPLLVWTVTNKEEYDKSVKKVDNIIFENLNLDSNGKFKG